MYVLENNFQWNSWIYKMIDYLKGSIVKFKLNFENASENKMESNQYEYAKYQVKTGNAEIGR